MPPNTVAACVAWWLKTNAYKMHACKRYTPCERCAYETHAYKTHACERCTTRMHA